MIKSNLEQRQGRREEFTAVLNPIIRSKEVEIAMEISLNCCNPGFELQVMELLQQEPPGPVEELHKKQLHGSSDLAWAALGFPVTPTNTTSPALSDHHAMEPKGMD